MDDGYGYAKFSCTYRDGETKCGINNAKPLKITRRGMETRQGTRSTKDIHRVGNSLVFCERESDSLVKKSELLPSLFCHELPEKIANGGYFAKNGGSESLKSLLKKRANEQRGTGSIRSWAYIQRGKLSKTYEKYKFCERISRFLRAIRSNNKRITHIDNF